MIKTRRSALTFPPTAPVGNKCWIDIYIINIWDQLTINNRLKMKGIFDVNCWHQIDVAHWHQQIVFQPKFCFIQNFVSPNRFASGHFLDTFLTSYWPDVIWYCYLTSYWPDVHMILAIWHQQDVNIRSTDDVPWYWQNADVNLRFKSPLGYIYTDSIPSMIL